MSRPLQNLLRFFRELKRRNVYKVAGTYAVVGFVLIQVADLTFVRLGLPPWTVTFLIVLVAMGFPLALVVAWAFEVTPDGVRRTPKTGSASEVVPESGEARSGSRAFQLLVAIGLVGATAASVWYLTGAGGEAPTIEDRTLAVLPFRTTDTSAEPWREGMVSILSIKMDGAGGLRAISDRAIFAAWEQRGLEEREASTEETLAAARQVGSEYALFGSASQFGQELHLTAQLYSTRSGDRLDQFEVRGPPDSVTALADSLARRTLAVLLGTGSQGLESVELGTLSTGSFTALKAYLRGELHFRAGDYGQAIAEYRTAVGEDSTFALAWARLARSLGWMGEPAVAEWRRAHRFRDRLRRRERRAIHAAYLLNVAGRGIVAADTLRRLTRDYPDDPDLWHDLGEVILHAYLPEFPSEADEAFQRAARLDPGVAPYERHLVDLAFMAYHDSALAAERIDRYPEGPEKDLYRLAFDLVFGSATDSARAVAALDTVTGSSIVVVDLALGHPVDLDLAEEVYRRDDIENLWIPLHLVQVEGWRGQMDDALALLWETPVPERVRDRLLTQWLSLDLPLPDSLLQRRLDPSGYADPGEIPCLQCVGHYLIDKGRADELDPLLSRYREQVGESADAFIGGGTSLDRLRDILMGYRAWREGESERALELWRDEDPGPPTVSSIWRGDAHRELGRLERAEAWYRSAWRVPMAHERLGQLYEGMGESEKAAAAYRRFIAAWKDADPELQPRVEAARERIRQLTRSEVEPDG